MYGNGIIWTKPLKMRTKRIKKNDEEGKEKVSSRPTWNENHIE